MSSPTLRDNARAARAHTGILPGSHDLEASAGEDLLGAICRAVDRGTRVASICTGATQLSIECLAPEGRPWIFRGLARTLPRARRHDPAESSAGFAAPAI
jgi:hypothetical protein